MLAWSVGGAERERANYRAKGYTPDQEGSYDSMKRGVTKRDRQKKKAIYDE